MYAIRSYYDPALQAVAELTDHLTFAHILNTGDSLVYGPYPDETISWLIEHDAVSIRGNTDKKVGKLRITSYNVCYTKLLREIFPASPGGPLPKKCVD